MERLWLHKQNKPPNTTKPTGVEPDYRTVLLTGDQMAHVSAHNTLV